jgi:hypothetical protein
MSKSPKNILGNFIFSIFEHWSLLIIIFASNLHPPTSCLHCQCLLNLNINLPAAKPSELGAG